MIRVDKLHQAIDRFYEAERVANASLIPLEDTAEEAALHASIEDIENGGYVATTATGAIAALCLLQKEINNFAEGPMSKPLIDGAMAYFNALETVSPGATRDALNMVSDFPEMSSVAGAGFFAVYDGLNACINSLCGIIQQPRCEADGYHLNSAGRYLESIEQFLMFERTRVMEIAAQSQPNETEGDKEIRLRAVLALRADEAELSIDQLEQVIAGIEALDKGRAAT